MPKTQIIIRDSNPGLRNKPILEFASLSGPLSHHTWLVGILKRMLVPFANKSVDPSQTDLEAKGRAKNKFAIAFNETEKCPGNRFSFFS